MSTTADVLIYAVGAGRGHAVRGQVIQSLLRSEGLTSILLVRPGALSHVSRDRASGGIAVADWTPGRYASGAPAAERLIVDSFPSGWQGELGSGFLSRFRGRTFVARFNRSLDWTQIRSRYERIVLPYDLPRLEWDTVPDGARVAGFFLRQDPPRFTGGDDALTVVDPENRCGPRIRWAFERLAADAGRSCRFVREFDREIPGRKILFAGAGYNTFFEADEQGADARFIPVAKRFDDQFRRVYRRRRGAGNLDAVRKWLSTESDHDRGLPPLARCLSAECFL